MRSQPRLEVGVAFGIEYTSVAYSFVNPSGETQEGLITEWPAIMESEEPKRKVPSVVWYDPTGDVIGWGYEMPASLKSNRAWRPLLHVELEQKVDSLILHLLSSADPTSVMLSQTDPPVLTLPAGKTALDVVSDYLGKIRHATQSTLRKTFGELFKENEVYYSFSISPMLDEAVKLSLRTAIVNAGYLSDAENRLQFILEPLAALNFSQSCGILGMQAKDVVLVVDSNSKTCRAKSYQASKTGNFVCTECIGMTNSMGTSSIIQDFNDLVGQKVQKTRLPKGSKTGKRISNKCVAEFTNRILTDFRNDGEEWAVDVNLDAAFPDADIEEGYMLFTNEEILKCFEQVAKSILDLIQSQIQDMLQAGAEPKMILITGNLSTVEYLFQRIKLHFWEYDRFDRRIVRTPDDGVAKAAGALASNTTGKLTIPAPIHPQAPATWLIKTQEPFNSDIHPPENLHTDLDGNHYCLNTGKIILPKGQVIPHGKNNVKISMSKLIPAGRPFVIEDEIYRSSSDRFYSCQWGCKNDFPTNSTFSYGRLYLNDSSLELQKFATVKVDLSRKNPKSDFKRFMLPSGQTYYLEYELVLSFGITDSVEGMRLMTVDMLVAGELVGTNSF